MDNQPSRESPNSKSALQHACDAAGGQKSLAARIGTTQSMVWYWLARSKRGVPGEFVLPIEAATGVSRHALRPDIYPAILGEACPRAFDPGVGTGSREENASDKITSLDHTEIA